MHGRLARLFCEKLMRIASCGDKNKLRGLGASVTTPEESLANLLAATKLHPFPTVALRLMQQIALDKVNFAEVGGLLKTDAAMSACVLRAANSPLFGVRGEIKSIPLALVTLGLDRVSLLILTSSMLRLVPGDQPTKMLRPWWRHNLATALFCKHLTGQDMTSEYGYMCGLMHSVGQLALFQAFPNHYGTLIADAAAHERELAIVERTNFGVDHCELGAALLEKWNIPEEIVDAAAHHHCPANGTTPFAELASIGCCVSNHIGLATTPRPPRSADDLPALAQELINDESLCLEITASVDEIESSMGAI